MTHLILHKVRGEPAFDVAEQIQIGDDLGWIIPTSGHRCYPATTWPLQDICYAGTFPVHSLDLPPDLPDHYAINDATPTPQPKPKSHPTLDDVD